MPPGSTNCEACPPGTMGNGEGTACSMCPPGRFQSRSGQKECHPCVVDDALCKAYPGALSTAPSSIGSSSTTQRSNTDVILPPKDDVAGRVQHPSAAGATSGGEDETQMVTKTGTPLDGIDEVWRAMAYSVLSLLVALILSSHRFWPVKCKKIDLVFADSHVIDDTHAMRMLDSRLGAAFTIALPFILAALAISIFGEPNVLVETGLQPSFTSGLEASSSHQQQQQALAR